MLALPRNIAAAVVIALLWITTVANFGGPIVADRLFFVPEDTMGNLLVAERPT